MNRLPFYEPSLVSDLAITISAIPLRDHSHLRSARKKIRA